ncbi:MAG: NAD(P)/FAD-dependent oxidoreductase [Candidatus Kerfeldbacteria bacterium]|nr:NAD(P)/FAD-dependent oxidoreductase [Candidatus Kerfeldbacteria bacterium]
MNKKHIGIIGGGLTGMTAALELLKDGHDITIIEGGSQTGGLAAGFTFEGASLEHAYHHAFKTDYDILDLIQELELKDQLNWFDSSMGVYYNGQLYPFRTPIDLLKFPPLRFWSKFRLGLTVLYLQHTKNWKRFEHVTAAEWMRKHCGKQAYEVIWKPLLHGKFHQYADQVSMAWLWARIHIRANSKEKGDSREKLGYMTGGFHTLIHALEERLRKEGVQIHLNEKVRGVRTAEQGTVQVETEQKTYTFDEVISTVSTHLFSQMLDSKDTTLANYKKQLASVQYLGAALVIFSSEQSLSPYYWVNVNDSASPFLAFIQHTNLAPTSWYNNRQVYYLATYVPHGHRFFTTDEAALKEEFFTYLKKIFPQFSPEQIHNTQVMRLRYAQHIVDTNYAEKMPAHVTPIPHVYLANFSQIFPEDRGMSYAIREGRKQAQLLRERL